MEAIAKANYANGVKKRHSVTGSFGVPLFPSSVLCIEDEVIELHPGVNL